MLTFVAMVMVMTISLPVGIDWQTWDVSTFEQIKSPYEMPSFTGMPFAFFALPHALLRIDIGNAVNHVLNI